jgi:hypothetical protein
VTGESFMLRSVAICELCQVLLKWLNQGAGLVKSYNKCMYLLLCVCWMLTSSVSLSWMFWTLNKYNTIQYKYGRDEKCIQILARMAVWERSIYKFNQMGKENWNKALTNGCGVRTWFLWYRYRSLADSCKHGYEHSNERTNELRDP